MTDRLHRERSLPEGYQFGQGAIYAEMAQRRADCPHTVYVADDHGVWCVNCGAEKTAAPPASPHTHNFWIFDPSWMSHFCRCGARRDLHGDVFELKPRPVAAALHPAGWNVIEGDY